MLRLLEGHEYGGQCVSITEGGTVFSASQDRSFRSWDSVTGSPLDQVTDHADYVQCLAVSLPWVATG